MSEGEPVHHSVAECLCPVCGYVTNGAMPAADNADPPEQDDLVICGSCAALLVFDECQDCGGLIMRLPTIEEAVMLTAHPRKLLEIKLAQMAVLQANIEIARRKTPDTH